jgi:acetyl/propionyl-CoA carboxylase alpha subunit
MFSKVLIANRGEIAVRIARALQELGVASVAVYSELDRDALHVKRADEAYNLGDGPAADNYLHIEKLLDVAARSGAQAVHPGYGFLAENAPFAQACEDAGVVFIGPPASAIEAMGSKTRARELMQAAGVPIVPGTTEAVATVADALRIAKDEIGFPVAVKAAGGGGGKGFRVALTEDELEGAFEGSSREGEKFFSDPTVYLERYLHDPRHVEVQVLADRHGNVIHLGERDCSIQRRHQKVIEESPAPEWVVTPEIRERIGQIGVNAAKAVDYVGAGTIEGLFSTHGGDGSGVGAGGEVSPMYDPMVAKLIVWDADREQATRRMLRALGEYEIEGLKTLIPFHKALLATENWAKGETCKDLLEDKKWLKTLAFPAPASPADNEDGAEEKVEQSYEVEVSGQRFDVRVVGPPFAGGGGAAGAGAGANGSAAGGRAAPKRKQRSSSGGGGGADTLPSPLQGNMWKVLVKQGDTVEEGQLLCIIEAMKMENEITAHKAGVIAELPISEGAPIAAGAPIATIKSPEAA